jgi:hypothetical protein
LFEHAYRRRNEGCEVWQQTGIHGMRPEGKTTSIERKGNVMIEGEYPIQTLGQRGEVFAISLNCSSDTLL